MGMAPLKKKLKFVKIAKKYFAPAGNRTRIARMPARIAFTGPRLT